MGRPRSKLQAFNNLYARYKTDAHNKGVCFELSKEQFKSLTSRKCRYCDSDPTKSSNKYGRYVEDYVYNGIDRIDSTKGYIYTNCLPCCETCNYMKRRMMPMEFFEHIYKIYKLHGKDFIPCLEEKNVQSA